MSQFALYENALAVYEKTKDEKTKDESTKDESTKDESTKDESNKDEKTQYRCQHNDTVFEGGVISCLECGEDIRQLITHEKEWRYYGSSDSKRSSDPNRVQIRKTDERNINKDVQNMGFSETIVTKADQLYSQVTKGQIYRGNSRKAIVFACIFHAYKMSGKHQTPDGLVKLFGLSRKNGLKGLKIVNVNAPKDSKIHTTIITPVHLVHDIMNKFKATSDQKKEVILLYSRIKNRSSKLNRSRPQSVAAALTYYWIKKKMIDINLKDFAKKVDLSELTINKNAKEVALVLGTPDVI